MAQERGRAWFTQTAREANGEITSSGGPYTVKDVMTDYIADYTRRGGKSLKETETRINAFILPLLGKVVATKLTVMRIRDWHAELAAAPARLRTRSGDKQKHRATLDGHDATRRRRATANRTLTVLKAALNHAFEERRLPSDDAWRRSNRSARRTRQRFDTSARTNAAG